MSSAHPANDRPATSRWSCRRRARSTRPTARGARPRARGAAFPPRRASARRPQRRQRVATAMPITSRGVAAPMPNTSISSATAPSRWPCAANVLAAPSVGPTQGVQTTPSSRPTRNCPPRPRPLDARRAAPAAAGQAGRRRCERGLAARHGHDHAEDDQHRAGNAVQHARVEADRHADRRHEQADRGEREREPGGQRPEGEPVLGDGTGDEDRQQWHDAGRQRRQSPGGEGQRERRGAEIHRRRSAERRARRGVRAPWRTTRRSRPCSCRRWNGPLPCRP